MPDRTGTLEKRREVPNETQSAPMESRSGMIERSDYNTSRDGDNPDVQTSSWGIETQRTDSGQVSFLHLMETKLKKRLFPGLIRGDQI